MRNFVLSGWKMRVRVAAAVVGMTVLMGVPAYAAGWERTEDGRWYYCDEEGEVQTGWVKADADGLWYYLDSETGVWVERPALDDETVVKLLENEIVRSGYYQREEGELRVQVDWRDETMIYASVCVQTGPNSSSGINSYEINKRSGNVHPAAGDNFNLYQ